MMFAPTHPMTEELIGALKRDAEGRWVLDERGPTRVEAILVRHSKKPGFRRALVELSMFSAYLASKERSADLACALVDALEAASRGGEAVGLETCTIERAKKLKATYRRLAAKAEGAKKTARRGTLAVPPPKKGNATRRRFTVAP